MLIDDIYGCVEDHYVNAVRLSTWADAKNARAGRNLKAALEFEVSLILP